MIGLNLLQLVLVRQAFACAVCILFVVCFHLAAFILIYSLFWFLLLTGPPTKSSMNNKIQFDTGLSRYFAGWQRQTYHHSNSRSSSKRHHYMCLELYGACLSPSWCIFHSFSSFLPQCFYRKSRTQNQKRHKVPPSPFFRSHSPVCSTALAAAQAGIIDVTQ